MSMMLVLDTNVVSRSMIFIASAMTEACGRG
jgi:hypothetical protein